jgi:hypothetical protein
MIACAVFVLVALFVNSCTPDDTPNTESDIEPFIPTIFDARAAVTTSMSEEFAEIMHAHLTGRWLLRLLSRNEAGSREEFQAFADRGDRFVFGYKLDRAMQRIDSGDLPEWAHDYFVDPPDEEHALVGCTADYYTENNPFFWFQFGPNVCERQMTSWLRDGENQSWTEWLISTPN